MIAMVLGLFVLAAATGIFMSSQQAYRTTERLGRLQESMQFGFELMARDIRDLGSNACDSGLPVANVFDPDGTRYWWSNWNQPLLGFDGGALAGSAGGTDAVQVLRMNEVSANILNHSGYDITVDDARGFENADIVMACDMRQLAVFRAGIVEQASGYITHRDADNCGPSLSVLPAPCTTFGPKYLYGTNAIVGRLHAVRWFVADNGRGGRSLYRVVDKKAREEIVEGVQDMQIKYLQGASAAGYVDAGGVGNWNEVTSLRVMIVAKNAAPTGDSLERRIEYVVNLRSRVP